MSDAAAPSPAKPAAKKPEGGIPEDKKKLIAAIAAGVAVVAAVAVGVLYAKDKDDKNVPEASSKEGGGGLFSRFKKEADKAAKDADKAAKGLAKDAEKSAKELRAKAEAAVDKGHADAKSALNKGSAQAKGAIKDSADKLAKNIKDDELKGKVSKLADSASAAVDFATNRGKSDVAKTAETSKSGIGGFFDSLFGKK